MSNANIFLHGFLGQPSDWQQSTKNLKNCYFYNLNHASIGDLKDFKSWTESFYGWVNLNVKETKRNLIGYSLGGRLALHTEAYLPEQFDKLILISTNPGLKTDSEKALRLDNDKKWAQKFLDENWNLVIKEWNEQAVFDGSMNEPQRLDSQFNRRQLSEIMQNFSLGKQRDFSNVNADWIVGENDKKYCQLVRGFKKIHIVQKSGHRVLFDQPELLALKLQDLLL